MTGEGIFLSRLRTALTALETEAVEGLIGGVGDRDDEMRGRILLVRELRDNVIPSIITNLTKED